MLIHKKHLILNLRDPGRVTSVIPSAKTLAHQGKNLVVVPHGVEEVRVLRNLGLDAPSPISSYYEWSGKYTPFQHQRVTAEELVLNPRMFCLNGLGSGKSLSVLWAYDWLRSEGWVHSMLIVAPLSTLERVWADEIFTHFPHLSFGVLHGTREQRHRVLAEPHDIYIINHDGIKHDDTLRAIGANKAIDIVVVDEIASFRNLHTERWLYLNRVINGNEKFGIKPKAWAWGLTGTPIPKEAADCFAQVKLLKPENIPTRSFTKFRDSIMVQQGPHRWINRPDSLQRVYEVMRPAVRFATADCIDLPPTTHIVRDVPLTAEQNKAYDQMLRHLQAEYEGGQITATNEAIKLNKLLQICCGAAYDGDGQAVLLPSKHRIDEARALIEQSESKTIIFVPFSAPLHHLAQELSKDWSVAVVDGSVPKAQRDRIFHDFQHKASPQVLVANAGTMAHGLTLTAASLIVWYGLPHSLEIFEQANARIPRPGQKLHTVIASLISSPVERRIYEKLRLRGRTQGVLLDMFRR